MDDFFINDEFAQFVINQYFSDEKKMTPEEKLDQVSSSVENFKIALDCFRLSSGLISKH